MGKQDNHVELAIAKHEDFCAGEAGVWAVDQEGGLWQRRGVGQHCPEGTMWASVSEVSGACGLAIRYYKTGTSESGFLKFEK